MMLMVSVQNLHEALEALRGEADIVDVKNLDEALVGSAHPHTVREVLEAVPPGQHGSVTLGVVPDQVGTVAMAVYLAGMMEATSVKVGFMNTEYNLAVEILLAARDALSGTETKLIGSLFADNPVYNGLDPSLMVKLARDGKCDGFLIDTLTKDGRNLFDFMTEGDLRNMVLEGKREGFSTALSGHLRIGNLDELARINPDIVGVRGAVCAEGDRGKGISGDAVGRFKNEVMLRQSGEIDVYGNGSGFSDAKSSDGWVVLDGTGKTCAGIISALTDQVKQDKISIVEVIIPDVLNRYDIIVWAEEGNHSILTQRQDDNGCTRLLIRP